MKTHRLLWLLLAAVGVTLTMRVVRGQDSAYIKERDVLYGIADGQKLLLDVYQPKEMASDKVKRKSAILFVHGGGWQGGSKNDFADLAAGFARHGYVCFSIDYRLVTETGNKYPAQLDDAQRAVRWVRAHAAQYGVDPNRLGALGASAGGHLVALLGAMETRDNSDPALAGFSSRVNCVVDLFGPTDLTAAIPRTPGGQAAQRMVENLIGKPRAEAPALYRDASPLFHVDRKTAPTLIFHGTADPLVPLDQSRRYYDALRKAGVEASLIIFEGEGHGFARKENQEKFLRTTWEFFTRHLAPAPAPAS